MVDPPVVGHGTGPLGTTVNWFCVGSGNGLMPPVPSSVDPIGIPARPTVAREPMVRDEAEAFGLGDAVVAVAHVPDAVPAIPVPSNSGVGADVPDIAPVAEDSPGSEPAVPPALMPGVAVCIAPIVLEHAEGVVIALEADELGVIGLTPGVASSVAPSGTPVTPTGAAAPIPSGEVIPSGGVTPPVPTCANAAPTLHNDQTVAATKIPSAVLALTFFMADLCCFLVAFFELRCNSSANSPMHENAAGHRRHRL